MSIVPALVTILRNDSAVAALVGDRVHVVAAPENAQRPLLVLVPSTEDDGYHLQGVNHYPQTTFQVICVGDDLEAADTLGDAVIELFENYNGAEAGRGLTVFREPINSYSHSPGQRVHRRIIGFMAWNRAAA